jgi:hypothetical protein
MGRHADIYGEMLAADADLFMEDSAWLLARFPQLNIIYIGSLEEAEIGLLLQGESKIIAGWCYSYYTQVSQAALGIYP